FNQSADHRRKGMNPEKMRAQIYEASSLLARRSRVECADYEVLLDEATNRDLVYMDPPYMGVSGVRDPRYHQQLDLPKLIENLERLNGRGVPFLLSFDGSLGGKEYGPELPRSLELTRVFVHTGRSSQATLNGKVADTVESVYLAPGLRAGGTVKAGRAKPKSLGEQLSLLV
ncbi:MAG: DNA adenine methylase, partial [Bryobacteraceae bacterium]